RRLQQNRRPKEPGRVTSSSSGVATRRSSEWSSSMETSPTIASAISTTMKSSGARLGAKSAHGKAGSGWRCFGPPLSSSPRASRTARRSCTTQTFRCRRAKFTAFSLPQLISTGLMACGFALTRHAVCCSLVVAVVEIYGVLLPEN
ncbi:unnamed protein product, partial [Symbiodinium necroappetens]